MLKFGIHTLIGSRYLRGKNFSKKDATKLFKKQDSKCCADAVRASGIPVSGSGPGQYRGKIVPFSRGTASGDRMRTAFPRRVR